jgi:hypothetical protein
MTKERSKKNNKAKKAVNEQNETQLTKEDLKEVTGGSKIFGHNVDINLNGSGSAGYNIDNNGASAGAGGEINVSATVDGEEHGAGCWAEGWVSTKKK